MYQKLLLCFALCNFVFCSSSSLYPYFYSTVPCISQTCPLSLWYCNSCSLLILTCNQSKSIEQSVLLINGKHNVQGHTICPLYSIQPTMHCTTVSILRLSPSHLQQPVCSLNWLILVVSHHLKQVKSILSGCVQSMTYVLYLYLIVATCVYQYGWHVH